MNKKRLTIGIVGGLCPLATADIYFKAMKMVRARDGDADYPDIIINAALEQVQRGNRFDNTPNRNYDMHHRVLYIYQVCRELRRRGVDKILVPDFLSYSFAGSISENIGAPLVDIVDVLARQVASRWPDAVSIGLLATNAAIEKKIFEAAFTARGLRVVYPDADVQREAVMEAVYGVEGVKHGVTGGKPGELIGNACENLRSRGAEVIVSAITELPLIERQCYPAENYLDCNEAIAEELVNEASAYPALPEKYGVIGILGGLGPAATVDIFDKIVRRTPASRDQDHIRIVIENNPKIPDRTAALHHGAEDPSVAMLATAEKLVAAGADFIIVPCNTAHIFIKAVAEHIPIPVLSMIEATAQFIGDNFAAVDKVGLLATSGTVESAVYQQALAARGIELIVPDGDSQQNQVMEAIYGSKGVKAGYKTGEAHDLLLAAAKTLAGRGARLVILGCTEIPLALKDGELDIPFVDPTDILAAAAVRFATAIKNGDSGACI